MQTPAATSPGRQIPGYSEVSCLPLPETPDLLFPACDDRILIRIQSLEESLRFVGTGGEVPDHLLQIAGSDEGDGADQGIMLVSPGRGMDEFLERE